MVVPENKKLLPSPALQYHGPFFARGKTKEKVFSIWLNLQDVKQMYRKIPQAVIGSEDSDNTCPEKMLFHLFL